MQKDTQKETRDEAIHDVKLYMANDWNLKEETSEYFILTKNTSTLTGHILIFVFFGWWTLGICNLAYWFIQRKTKKIIK